MNFFDDLKTRALQEINKTVDKTKNDVNSYINANITEPLVKVGQAARGNLTEAQIKAGQKGATPPILPSPEAVQAVGLSMGGVAVIGLLAYFLFFSKKSRG